MAAFENGCPVQIAALDYDVPKSTLRSHVMDLTLSRKRGRKLVLSSSKEEKLVQYIYGMARYGHPLNLIELKIKIVEVIQLHKTPFIDGVYGTDGCVGLKSAIHSFPCVCHRVSRTYDLHRLLEVKLS
jgi:hypothetical protein